MKNNIYLDHNASTPIRPAAFAVMTELLRAAANPSAIHKSGRFLRAHIEEAREKTAAALNAETPENVVFTSGATEANIAVLNGCSDVRHVIVSDVEHPSVRKSRDDLAVCPVDSSGLIRLEALEEALREAACKEGGILVSVMMVNNETGVIQPLPEIVALARQYGAFVHTDAAQAFGRVPVDMQALGVDALTLSGHKIGAAQGVGAMILRSGFTVRPLLRGGGQEKGRRAGTENAAAIAGFGAAIREAAAGIETYQALSALRDRMESEILRITPESVIFGRDAPRTANTCFFATPGLDSQALMIALDLEGIAVTAGTACSSGSTRKSTVLAAMGASQAEQDSSLRVSLGWSSTAEDVDAFIAAWQKICTRMKSNNAA